MTLEFLKLRASALVFALGCLLVPFGSQASVPVPTPTKRPKIEKPTAIVYVSAHCGPSGRTYKNVCQLMMEELREAGVPFVTRDIFDERWREEYVKKMESIGRRPPAVPLADIEGELVLGALNGISNVAAALRRGEEPRRLDDEPGYTKPQSPKKSVYEAGQTWVEPPDAPAIVYGGKWCVHCPATRRFLKKQKVKSIELDANDPKVDAEQQAHMARFGKSGSSVPCVYIFGRFLFGFDDPAIEALVHWRNTLPKEPAPPKN